MIHLGLIVSLMLALVGGACRAERAADAERVEARRALPRTGQSAPGATPPESISVTLEAPTTRLEVGQAVTLRAIVRGTSGMPVARARVDWSTSAAAVATVTREGLVSAARPGTATIEARSGAARAAVIVRVVPAATTRPWANEPVRARRITERGFAALVEDGWWLPDAQPYLTIVRDDDARRSGPTVAQARFPAGYAGGDAPVSTEVNLGSNRTELYVSFWMKLSPAWHGHASGVNKIFHIFIGGANRIYLSAQGTGRDALQPQVRLQGVPMADGAVNLEPNLVPDAQVVRGRWQRWELVVRANTAGRKDGSVDWWIDGVKVGSHSGLGIVTADQGHGFELLQWNPTWGGVGDTVPAEQYMRLDHLYVSGQ